MAACTEGRQGAGPPHAREGAGGVNALSNYTMFSHFAGLYLDRIRLLADAAMSCLHGRPGLHEAGRITALDVGASDGALSLEVGRRLDNLFGIRRFVALEPEVDALPTLRKRSDQAGFEFVVLDRDLDGLLRDPEVSTAQFDVILSVHSAYHLGNLADRLERLRGRLTGHGALVLIADSMEGAFYRFVERIDALLAPPTVGLFGDRVYGETVAQAVGREGQVSRLSQTLSFRSVADLLLATAFIGRYDLLSLSTRISEVVDVFERMFKPLPTTIPWPEICVVVGASEDRASFRKIPGSAPRRAVSEAT